MTIALSGALQASPALGTASATTFAVTTNAAVPSNGYIIGFVADRITNAAVVSSVSGGGLTWTVDVTEPGSTALGVSLFSAQAPAGLASATTVTATLNLATTRQVMGLWAFTGIATSTPVGTTGVNNGTTGNPTGVAVTPTSGDMLVAAFEHNVASATETGTASTNFTKLGDATAGTSSWTQGLIEYAISTGASLTPSFTPSVSTTTNWAAVQAIYHAAAGAVIRAYGPIIPMTQAVARQAYR